MTLNKESLGNLTIEGNSDTNQNVYMGDTAIGGWIYYNVTDRVVAQHWMDVVSVYPES